MIHSDLKARFKISNIKVIVSAISEIVYGIMQ